MKTLTIIVVILIVAIAAGQGPVLSAAAGAAKAGFVNLMPDNAPASGDEQDGDPEDGSGEP